MKQVMAWIWILFWETLHSFLYIFCASHSFLVCMYVSRGRYFKKVAKKQRIKRKKMTEGAPRISISSRKYKIYINISHFKIIKNTHKIIG